MKIKLVGRGCFDSEGHVLLYFLPLIGHNLLLVYYHWFEHKGDFYKYGLH